MDTNTYAGDPSVVVGPAGRQYQVVPDWPRLPPDVTWEEVVAVATDSRARVYVFNRGKHPLMIFDRDGAFLDASDVGPVARPHGITIGPDDTVYCVDDFDHTVRIFGPSGRRRFTLGASGRPSDTGATSIDYRTIQHAGPPFHYPTNLAVAAHGELYITDGYGNVRVHRFSSSGQWLASWGEPGSGPGQFQIPHGIAVDRQGIVHVADRENSRIQRFSPQGEYIDQWTDVARPCEVFIDARGMVYVAELGFRAGRWPGSPDPPGDAPGGRLSIFNGEGDLLARWGGGDSPCAPGDFFAPHDVWVDAFGDIYVSEVVQSAGANKGLVSADCHTLQKFARRDPRST